MKKKRFAVKFFSLIMVLCVMVGLSAACMLFIEHEVSQGNKTFCVPQDLVQELPYNGCHFIGNVAAGTVGYLLRGFPRMVIPVVAFVNVGTRMVCAPVERIRLSYSRENAIPNNSTEL
jgi:hypothetical protein